MQKCDFNKVAKQFWISNVTQHEIKITKASVFRLPLKYRKKKKTFTMRIIISSIRQLLMIIF